MSTAPQQRSDNAIVASTMAVHGIHIENVASNHHYPGMFHNRKITLHRVPSRHASKVDSMA
jgi:hypothetical protein